LIENELRGGRGCKHRDKKIENSAVGSREGKIREVGNEAAQLVYAPLKTVSLD
jgi:hypothetical protein